MRAPDPGLARRLRIAHVVAVYPPYWAGTGNVAYFNARELARRGHDVHVFTAQRDLDGYQDPVGVTVHRLRAPLRIGNAPFTPGLVAALRGFDLVHLHWPYMFGAELTWLAVHLWRVPYVMTYHLDLRGDRRWIFAVYQRMWGPLLARGAAKVLAVTAAHLRSSQVYPALAGRPDDIIEAPNGVDTVLFTPAVTGGAIRSHLGIPTAATVIIFVGAMDSAHEYKGVPDLLEAFRLLNDPNAWLLLVGDGDLLPAYRDVAGQLPPDTRERIIFAGSVPHDRLPTYYVAADVGVLPSRQPESFGMVLIEAMACGKPVIASDSPGVRSVVSDGVDGLLIRPGDIAGLAAALGSLLADPERRQAMGQAGRAKVEAKYAWERIGVQLDRLYTDVVAAASQEMTDAAWPGCHGTTAG